MDLEKNLRRFTVIIRLLIKWRSVQGLSLIHISFRHTASHIMAQAIKRLYPDAKLAIGPSIADGFYYDIDKETPLTAEDLDKIEAEMKKIVKENLEIKQYTMPREEAIAYFKEKNEPYKVELIEDLPEGETISFYSQGEFTDLCAGPHLMTTKPVKAFKLTSLAGAYWRGDEHNKMLQRIYGTAFSKKAELEEYLTMIEEAKKRDHRKLGKELGLFMTVSYTHLDVYKRQVLFCTRVVLPRCVQVKVRRLCLHFRLI